MRISLSVFLFIGVLLFSEGWTSLAEDKPAQHPGKLQKLLTSYLTDRLAEAQLALKNVQRLHESGMVNLSDVLAAQDAIDQWGLSLRLTTEWGFVGNHPVFRELRREFSVPEPVGPEYIKNKNVISQAIQEYLRRKLVRAEQTAERAVAMYDLRRATEAEVAAAKNKVEGLKLLLEAEQLGLGEGKE
jgi:hypothetical protein